MKAKCKYPGCVEPCHCRHGFCQSHCSHHHPRRDYSWAPKPRTKEPHISVEIEVEFRDGDALRRALGMGIATSDGSLSDCSAEFKVCSVSTNAAKRAAQIAHTLWEIGGVVSSRCGLHVHVDTRQTTSWALSDMREWCFKTELGWAAMIPMSRWGSNYVRSLTENNGHYSWWNRSERYPTFEVRLHPGTINPYKIAGWISVWKGFQDLLIGKHSLPEVEMADNADMATVDAAKRAIRQALHDHAPKEALEYVNARWANSGVLRDKAYRSREEDLAAWSRSPSGPSGPSGGLPPINFTDRLGCQPVGTPVSAIRRDCIRRCPNSYATCGCSPVQQPTS